MTTPDFASPIRPEEFPSAFREIVREIGSLVMERTAVVQDVERKLLAVSDEDLIDAQMRSHFNRAEIANDVAKDFSKAMDGRQS